MLNKKLMQRNLARKEVKGMKRGLIAVLLVGLCLGLLFLTEANLVQADPDYGAYKDFIGQLSPTLRRLAEYGLLQQWINNSASGVTLGYVTADGQYIKYAAGVQFEGRSYDGKQKEWYLTTIFVNHGGMTQYAIGRRLLLNDNDTPDDTSDDYYELGPSFITTYTLNQPEFEIALEDGLDGYSLSVADIENIVNAVTQGTPTASVALENGASVTATLTNVYLSGAQIFELGPEGIDQYLDSLGLEPGCVRVRDGGIEVSWTQFNGWEALRDFIVSAGLFVPPADSDPEDGIDDGWDDNDWKKLFASIKGHLDRANSDGVSEFKLRYGTDDEGNPLEITFHLKKEGGAIKLQYKDGDNHWQDTDLTIANYTPGTPAEGQLRYGPGENDVVPIEQATPEQLRASQLYALKLMADAAIESGVGPAENAVSMTVAEGTNRIDPTIFDRSILEDVNSFKAAMMSSPWADEVNFSNWTQDHWQELYDKVMTLFDDDPDNNQAYGVVFQIGGYDVKFVAETTDRGAGFKIVIKGADGTERPVRHIAFSEGPEPVEADTFMHASHIITQYRILAGKDRGTVGEMSDPTVVGRAPDPNEWGDILWGDPTAVGIVNYDASTGALTMTVTQWKDELGNWHYETLTVTLDFSKIADLAQREAVRQEFITAARNGSTFVCYGMGDVLRNGDIFYILGLGEH